VAAIRASNCTADAEASLRKVETVAGGPTDPIVSGPPQKRGIDPALENEILYEATDFVIGKGTEKSGSKSKAAAESSRHIVFAASFPSTKGADGADPALARIQAEHDFTHGDFIEATGFGRFEI
jgi:hypothetical protein